MNTKHNKATMPTMPTSPEAFELVRVLVPSLAIGRVIAARGAKVKIDATLARKLEDAQKVQIIH